MKNSAQKIVRYPEGGAGLDEPDAVPEEPGTGGVAGPKKCPHPRTSQEDTVTAFKA